MSTPEREGSTLGAPATTMVEGGPWRWIRNRFVLAAGGLSTFPLLVLFGLNFIDEFDTAAFGVVAPEIKAAFGLTNAAFGTVLAINFLVVLALSVLVGYAADRSSRIRIAQGGALIAGLGSMFTGAAPVLWALVLARIVNGAGLLVNGPVHKSLLTDYYRPQDRGSVFALHEAANPFGRILAPIVVGSLAAVVGWRAPFFVFAVPLFAFVVLSVRLKEPVRGGTDQSEDAMQATHEAPVRFDRGVRMLAQSKTLRRSWIGLIFIGAAFLPLVSFITIFYDTVFGVGPLGRGWIASLGSLATLAGLLLAGRLIRILLQRHGPAWVQVVSGGAITILGALLVVFALQDHLVLAVTIGTLISFIGGFSTPAGLTVQALVAPPRARTLGLSFGALFLAAGAFLTPIAGSIADTRGLRWGMVAFAPMLAFGGLVIASAYRWVVPDHERAQATLSTAAALRRTRLAAAGQSILVCRDVDVFYGQVQVLFGVNFEVKQGEIVALLGTNGAGKSTLLKAIAGALTPDRGVIFFDGEEISAMTPWEATASGVVLMPGGRSVFPTLTVADNLKLAGWLYRKDAAYIEQRTEGVLETFPRLRERLQTPAGQLSGGEQQMISLAQTLIAKPRLLMIDELSLGLSPKIVAELLEIVRRIHDEGVTIILVEQSVNVALTLAQHAFFMEKGEIRFDGPTDQLLERPDILRAVFLGGARKAKAPQR